MAVYGDVAGFFGRYPAISTKITSLEVSSAYLPSASEWVERRLAAGFVLPFSANNATARELTYTRALLTHRLRTVSAEDSEELRGDLLADIEALLTGQAAMTMDSSAAPIFATPQFAQPAQQAFGTHANYPTTFSVDEPELQRVDPNMLIAEERARGLTTVGSV